MASFSSMSSSTQLFHISSYAPFDLNYWSSEIKLGYIVEFPVKLNNKGTKEVSKILPHLFHTVLMRTAVE